MAQNEQNHETSATRFDQLMIQGLQPAQTQQSQFMLQNNVDKYMSIMSSTTKGGFDLASNPYQDHKQSQRLPQN